MTGRTEELRATAAECLALARSTTEPQTRAALLSIAQKLYAMSSDRAGVYEAAQRDFNEQQMLLRKSTQSQQTMQQQQQIQAKKEDE